MADRGNQGEKDADLAIAHIIGEAVVLFADASGMFAALEKTGLIESSNDLAGSQRLQSQATDLIAHAIGVPVRLREQGCMPYGLASRACSASCQPFSRSTPLKTP
jgi:hypothetical protein